jgi:hypothetical protein
MHAPLVALTSLTLSQSFPNFALVFRKILPDYRQLETTQDARVRFSLQQKSKTLLDHLFSRNILPAESLPVSFLYGDAMSSCRRAADVYFIFIA